MRIKEERGFTLLEVLLALTIGGMVMMLAGTVYISGLNSWDASYQQLELQQNLRIAMDRLTREIRQNQKKDLWVDSNLGQINQLVVKDDSTGEKYRYGVVNGVLKKINIHGSDQPITTDGIKVVNLLITEQQGGFSIYLKGVGDKDAKGEKYMELWTMVGTRVE